MDVSEMARLGGLARAKNMTPEQRRKSAHKAAEAAARVHREKAKAKKAAQPRPATSLATELRKTQKRRRNRNRPLTDLKAELRKSR